MTESGEASSSRRPGTPPKVLSSNQGDSIVSARGTPRSVKANAGDYLQHHVAADVMKEMADEMHECPLENFLDDYAPFHPSPKSIDAALQYYTDTGKLVKSNNHPGGVVWADFQLSPSDSKRKENENRVFAHLQAIVDDLRQLECFEEGVNKPREPQFHYLSCPNNWMAGEIKGTNFRVDACITSNPGSKTVVLAETAVVAEFKKSGKNEGPYQNRRQLVSAANQIMNDDPRRTWIYGITIEDTMMSVWYFCRSHSVKSAAFNFTTDIKTFIHVFMSFLYATPEEIGYDPTIHRELYDNKFHYIYELKTDEGTKYFRTIEPLFNSRVLCITGRKTRVWRAIEVRGSGDFAAKDGASEIALKDVWLEVDADTEKQNQDKVFDALEQLDEKAYSWATGSLYNRLKEAIQKRRYRNYFMEIKYDTVLPGTKPLSTAATVAPDLLLHPRDVVPMPTTPATTSMPTKASGNIISSSSQVNASSDLSVGPPRPPGKPKFPRVYQVRKHYRLVYGQVGHSLDQAKDIGSSFVAVGHAFVGLVLLYLARWVHRDVSVGNIILVEVGNMVQGKLSDLEYAKKFGTSSAGGDPKTGTPFFMPVEIHNSEHLYNPPTAKNPKSKSPGPVDPFFRSTLPEPPAADSPPPLESPPEDEPPALLFRFQHDLESLWWIIIWILLRRVMDPNTSKNLGDIFVPDYTPGHDRTRFFKKTFRSQLRSVVPSRLIKSIDDLDNFRAELYNFSVSGEMFYRADDPVVYTDIYNGVWESLVSFVLQVKDLNNEFPLHNGFRRGVDPQVGQSRPRLSGSEDTGPPLKKAKGGKKKEVEGEQRVTGSQMAKKGVPVLHMRV
ncbi:hypothetical protein P691DRAFT_714815 [Macrolepiota fuliginosa MF-IS2]|uniref:Fungal-type protein kinase domain-containing protein n=1 Tax=Macrolepiota fuliginosa MF-IS2 TaxID=1400762 RepID=A0A9P5X206_9AGAR|nr:hypothetical protein P691DRAFT_714815 [Macrolepiota fuliginosa MF-IS2]